jgi:hypothetical protein
VNRVDFIHETAIRVAAALSAPAQVDAFDETTQRWAFLLTEAEIAERAKSIALALVEAFDVEHTEGADVLEDEPWRGR